MKWVEYVIAKYHSHNDKNDHVSWYHLILKMKKDLKNDKKNNRVIWYHFIQNMKNFIKKMMKNDNVQQALHSKSSLRPTNYLLVFSQTYRKWRKTFEVLKTSEDLLLHDAFETIWK